MKSAYAPSINQLGEFIDSGVSASVASTTASATKLPLRGYGARPPFGVIADDLVYITQPGRYLVWVQVLFNFSSATGTRRAELWKNGALVDWCEHAAHSAGNVLFNAGPFQLNLQPGDYLGVYCRQDSGSSQPCFGQIMMQRQS